MVKLKKNNRLFYTLMAVAFSIIIAVLFSQNNLFGQTPRKPPLITNGYLDLTQWDFEKNSTLMLNGDWDFYEEKFVDPILFSEQDPDYISETKERMAVPSDWNKGSYNINEYAKGYGTYHVKIKLNKQFKNYGIKVLSIRSAHEMYVDGEKIGGSGVLSDSETEGVIGNVPYAAYFLTEGTYLDMVIHVSEYHNPIGGLVKPIYFGSENGISVLNLKSIFFNVLSAGSLIMTGIIFLGLYFYWRDDKTALFLALYCLSFSFFTLTYDERVLLQLIVMPYEFAMKCLNLSLFFSFSCILLFMNKSNFLFFSNRALKVYLGLFALWSILILISPYSFYTRFEGFYFLTALSSYFLIVINIGKVLIIKNYGDEGRNGTILLFFSAVFITINLISGILHNESKIYEFVTSQLTVFLFLGTTSLYLAKKRTDTYSKVEVLVDQLKQVDRIKVEFLVNTAHKFKTPLNGIINIANGGVDDKKNILSNDQRDNLNYIKAIAMRLSDTINDIMDMQRIKGNKVKLHITTVDIQGPLQIVIALLGEIYLYKDIEIVNEVSPYTYYVVGDENRIRQIFNNLIGNALKYTEHGQVVIKAEKITDSILVYIQDTGLGIEKDRQKTIFNFSEYSESSSQWEHHPTGIGLPLSCKLAEQMKGTIKLLVSEVGIGSTFCLTLPASEKNIDITQVKKIRRENKREDFSNVDKNKKLDKLKTPGVCTILIVDDEVTNIEALKAIIKQKDYRIISSYSGKQSLEVLHQRGDIDLVLLDVMMPGLSGFETLAKLREIYTIIDLPILIMSDMNDIDSITYGLKHGANDYITKPFEERELLARVKNCLNLKMTYKQMLNLELMFLQAQIKPHFIFNTLSIISSLFSKDPLKAKEILLDLADYLRLSFDFENNSGLTTLENEISLVKAYTSIEQARFSKRLIVSYDIDPDIDCTIPVLSIQPLVENAVRHGIMKNISAGIIMISVKWIKEDIVITVKDNGSGIDEELVKNLLSGKLSKGHVGISNIHNRLSKLYGEGLEYVSGEKGTSVSFKIPYFQKEEIYEHNHS
jgi:sensor histidine kinase YesM